MTYIYDPEGGTRDSDDARGIELGSRVMDADYWENGGTAFDRDTAQISISSNAAVAEAMAQDRAWTGPARPSGRAMLLHGSPRHKRRPGRRGPSSGRPGPLPGCGRPSWSTPKWTVPLHGPLSTQPLRRKRLPGVRQKWSQANGLRISRRLRARGDRRVPGAAGVHRRPDHGRHHQVPLQQP